MDQYDEPYMKTRFHSGHDSDYSICLVCSSGGHLFELHSLKPWWSQYQRFWVTFQKPDAISLLEGETVVWGSYPTNRNIPNLVRNTILAIRILRKERPDLIVSTGAGIAVPFFWIGKLFFRCKTVYIEMFTRMDKPSLTARLIFPVGDRFLVQRKSLLSRFPRSEYIGPVI